MYSHVVYMYVFMYVCTYVYMMCPSLGVLWRRNIRLIAGRAEREQYARQSDREEGRVDFSRR